MSMKYEVSDYTESEYLSAIHALESIDTYPLARDYKQEQLANPGKFIALRCEPSDGSIYIAVEVSDCCSTDEYFRERGPMSRFTLLSGNASCETPGPEDGYEWEASEDGYYYGHPSTGSWFLASNLEEAAEELDGYDGLPDGSDLHEFVTGRGYYRFDVSTDAVDPDYSSTIAEIESTIKERIAELSEAALLTSEETNEEGTK